MAYVNKVFLLGNLTRAVELKYTPSGAAVAKFGIAISEKYKDKESVTYVDITVWNKSAEACQKHLGKGSQVMIEGRLQFDQWDDKETGKKRSKLSVTAINVQFIGSRQDSQHPTQREQQGQYNQDRSYAGEYNQSPPEHSQAKANGFQTQDRPATQPVSQGYDPNTTIDNDNSIPF